MNYTRLILGYLLVLMPIFVLLGYLTGIFNFWVFENWESLNIFMYFMLALSAAGSAIVTRSIRDFVLMFALLVLGTYFFPFGWMPIIIIVLTILISIFGTQQMKFELEEILIPVIILAIYLIFCYFLDMPPFVDFGYL